MSESSQHDIKG